MSEPPIEILEKGGGIYLMRGAYPMCKCSHISDARFLKLACECLARERKKVSKKFDGVFDGDKV